MRSVLRRRLLRRAGSSDVQPLGGARLEMRQCELVRLMHLAYGILAPIKACRFHRFIHALLRLSVKVYVLYHAELTCKRS